MSLPRCFGVFGHPIGHSRSPSMHAAAFEVLGLPHRYLPFDVPRERLADALGGAKAMGFGGVNLTVPLKTDAVPLMDRLAPEAEAIGAVNTVCVTEDGLLGRNTDGEGFVEGVRSLLGSVPNRAVLLGGGGASRAIAHGLLAKGCSVAWVSRRPAALPEWTRVEARGYDALASLLPAANLLINATSVGMRGGPEAFPVPVPLERLPATAAVVDVVYPRPHDGLLDRAAARGLAVQDGLPMLWGQGVRALEHWLSQTLPPEARAAMATAIGIEM